MTFHLSWTHSTRTGYGRYGTKLAAALTGAGYVSRQSLGPDDDPCHLAAWVTTPNHPRGWFDGQHTVLSTMWESGSLPEGFREGFHNFDQILVPSEQNLELFSEYHPNVAKLPLGIDDWDWRYRPRATPANRFVFLCCGDGPRKGTDLAIAAFQRVFNPVGAHSPRPILIIKSIQPVDGALGGNIQNVTGFLSDLDEQDLYASAHVYLQPSRGEGFGLMPLQAIASGLPTILTDAHGHKEFARLGWPIRAGRSQSAGFLFGEAGEWWEPDLDDLCGRMLEIYRDYDLATKEARVSADIAHQLFSWERCAERFVDAVGEEHFFAPYSGDGSWVAAERKSYPVMVNRYWRAEMAGVHYQFDPGVEYLESADVKRILYETGVLDPACIDADHPAASGLTPAQLENLEAYSASQSYCHACGQKLNSGERHLP